MAYVTEKARGGTAGLGSGAQTESAGTHFHCLPMLLSSLVLEWGRRVGAQMATIGSRLLPYSFGNLCENSILLPIAPAEIVDLTLTSLVWVLCPSLAQ